MNAIGYIRVSTEEQSREGVSLEMQSAKIRAYAELNDVEIVEIIEDAGISAKNISGRPGFRRALNLVYSGEANALIIWKLDRAFRCTQDALNVAETLNRRGRGLISVSEQLDTTSAIGRFFFTLMASLAEMERNVVSERTSAVLQSKRAAGERVGEIPFGYRLDADGIHLIEEPREQEILGLIERLRAEGMSYRAISRELNRRGIRTKKRRLWTHVQIGQILRRAA